MTEELGAPGLMPGLKTVEGDSVVSFVRITRIDLNNYPPFVGFNVVDQCFDAGGLRRFAALLIKYAEYLDPYPHQKP